MLVEETLKQTPLFAVHRSLNARMVPFGGWDMPLQYEGILAEYETTRRACAVFDTSHIGEFLVEGDHAQSGLDGLITCSLKDMPLKTCRYATLLNAEGGVMDDLIVFRLAQERWFIVVNGATTAKDANQFQAHISKQAVFRNISQDLGKLDVQGPLARGGLKSLVPQIEKLSYYTFDEFVVLGEKVIVSRTGYTGELGYEIYFPWQKTPELWNSIFKDKRVKPAGLGARDVLRLEMGYSLYGHELDETISPLEAGLEKFVDFNKDFIGKAALLKQKQAGVKRKLVCFSSESRRSPRTGHKIYNADQQEIGLVTSGTFSPSLAKGIGMGLVVAGSGAKGEKILFGDAHNTISGEITARPFYKNSSLKN